MDDERRRHPDPDNASADPRVARIVRAALKPLDAEATRDVDVLECPVSSTALARYTYLREPLDPDHLVYAFTIDLRGRPLDVLPTLVGSTVQAMRFLDAGRCALSFIVGDEVDDGTAEVIEAMRELTGSYVGARYKFQRSSAAALHSPAAGAAVRNGDNGDPIVPPVTRMAELAMLPLVGNQSDWETGLRTTLVFMNDVVICLEDILELIHQLRWQKADSRFSSHLSSRSPNTDARLLCRMRYRLASPWASPQIVKRHLRVTDPALPR